MQQRHQDIQSNFEVVSILRQTIDLLKQHFMLFFVLGLIPSVLGAVALYLPVGFQIIIILVAMIAGIALQGSGIYGAIQALRGRPDNVGVCLNVGMKKILLLLGTGILMFLGVVLGTCLLIVPGIMVAIMFLVAIPAVMVENLGVIDALKRSMELTKGYKWQIFFLLLIYGVLNGAVSFIQGSLVSFLGSIGVIVPLLFIPIVAACSAFSFVLIAVIYLTLRRTKEGISVDQVAQVFD